MCVQEKIVPELPSSYLAPGLEAREVPGKGWGVFALQAIQPGQLIAAWGGTVMPEADFRQQPPELISLSVQIEEGLYLVPERLGPGDRINHCCDPNAGMQGHSQLVARRAIAPGEEVCYDYAMTDSGSYDEFDCLCGAANCRGRVTGRDWLLPELWARYDGFFSGYLQRRIAALRREYDPVEDSANGR
jgi:hypothetical protein